MSALRRLLSSRSALQTISVLSRYLSPAAADKLSRAVAGLITLAGGELYTAIRDNQAQVRGMSPRDRALKGAVKEVLSHAGKTYYDLFHFTAREIDIPVSIDPSSQRHLTQALEDPRGLVVVSAHLSNFDLGIRFLSSLELPMQVLSLTEPTAGFRILNRLRSRPNCIVTPIDGPALREAMRRLGQGGMVATGVDRPVPGKLRTLPFFGRPAPLPLGHARLAMRAGALLLPIWITWSSDQGYAMHACEPLEPMPSSGEHGDDATLALGRQVLTILETPIAALPHQWLMFLPVWRDTVQFVIKRTNLRAGLDRPHRIC